MPILCPTRRVYGTNEPTGIEAAQRAAYRLARYYYAFKYYLYYRVNIEITIDKSLPPVLLFPCKHKKKVRAQLMDVYTMEKWQQDRSFSAEPGQEITEDVYNEMLNCMPPKTLPRGKAEQALQDYRIPVHAGFLMGEPHSASKDGQLYLAFGMNDYGKGKHYYYLGLSLPAKVLHGTYYYFDCLNAFVNDGLFKESEFADDAEAISTGANYEATVYKYEYKHGERVSSKVLYDPWACFDEKGTTE